MQSILSNAGISVNDPSMLPAMVGDDIYPSISSSMASPRPNDDFVDNDEAYLNPDMFDENGDYIGDEEHESLIIWEMEHAERMRMHARDYFAALPRLTLAVVGQLVWGTNAARRPAARKLSTGRDDCHTYIRRMFGSAVLEELR